jgi:hypothetical protein
MKKLLLVLVILLIPFFAYSQKVIWGDPYGSKVDTSRIKPWIAKKPSDYKSVSNFGFSDGETYFLLIITDDSCYAQIRSPRFTEDGKSSITLYENLTNVRIKGNKFFSDKTDGEFVIYEFDNKKIPGLIVKSPWSGSVNKGDSEFGHAFSENSLTAWMPGKYPEASLRLLNKHELENKEKSDLQIMRNEIYARYGFIFKKDGDMDKYFKKQEWYRGQNKDVSAYLTGLEKRNLNLIGKIENE